MKRRFLLFALVAAMVLSLSFGALAAETRTDIFDVGISSNSAKGTAKAIVGDKITLAFSTDKSVEAMKNFTINGKQVAIKSVSSSADAYAYEAEYTVTADDAITGKAVPFAINVKNDSGTQYFTMRSTSDDSAVTIVDQKPVISEVSIQSSNADKTKATLGDTITLSFKADEAVKKLSSFKINGSNPDSKDLAYADGVYTATHLVDTGDIFTDAPVTFQINVENAKGIYSQTVEATTDTSFVKIVDYRPQISNVKISSNSKKGADKAALGDTITLTFTADKAVEKLSSFKINGSNIGTLTAKGNNVYTATHLVDEGDLITGKPVTFQINVKDGSNIYSQTVEVTTDKSSVTIVDEKPIISNVKISSDSKKGTDKATLGDTITLTFTSDEAVGKLGNFKINGSNPDTFSNEDNVYTATHKVDEGDKITGKPVTFQINVKNDRGIYSQTVEATTDKSSVTIVDGKPIISNVKISSDSKKGTDKATLGDTITLTFTSDEAVGKLGNFKINSSNPDTFSNEDNVYTATHKVDEGDKITGKPITFQINVKNNKGIYSQTVEATTDKSSVTIVDGKPVISNVKITSGNADKTKATLGDTITLTFTADEAVTKLSNFKINGSNPDTFTNKDNVYTATHKVDEGDLVTGKPVTFQINVKNANGIYSLTVEAVGDKSSVTIYRESSVIYMDGTEVLKNMTPSTYIWGTVTKLPESIEKAGYTFVGWFDNKELAGTAVKEIPATANGEKTVYAKWEQVILPFKDVDKKAWYYDAAMYAYQHNLIKGTADDTFSPNTNTSRAMMISILWRMAGAPVEEPTSTFTDVKQDYYTGAVAWGVNHKIIAGYGNGKFGPHDNVTREQVALIMYNYAKSEGYKISVDNPQWMDKYADTKTISSWAKESVTWAVSTGLIAGRTADTIVPQGTATRAEVAQIFKNFNNKILK